MCKVWGKILLENVLLAFGVTCTSEELTFSPPIHSLSHACHYQLRQLNTVARSLTNTATANLSMLSLLPDLATAALSMIVPAVANGSVSD